MLVTQKGILNNIESITGMLAFGADVVDAFFFGWRGGGGLKGAIVIAR